MTCKSNTVRQASHHSPQGWI